MKVKKSAGGSVLRHFMLTQNDLMALDHLVERYAAGRRVTAGRMAIRMQATRDVDGVPAKMSSMCHRIAETVKGFQGISQKLGKDRMGMVLWTCRLDDKASSELASVVEKWGFKSLAEAARFSIRVQSELDGFVPNEGW